MGLATRPLTNGFGAEVLGVDLAAALPDTLDDILDLLTDHALVLFRRQTLDDGELASLAKAFGPVGIASKRSCLSTEHQEVMYVSNLMDGDGRLIGGLGPGDQDESTWHSDQSFRPTPATLSMLFCVHPPPRGGGTGFASTTLAYEAMPRALRERLEPLRTLYRPRAAHEIEIVDVSHPAVLENPRNGRRAVYVSELCHGFAGLDDAEGRALLDETLSYVLRDEHIYTHEWRMGDLVLYDNAQLLHRREAFHGLRWLKATRSHAPTERFAIIN